MGWARVLQSVVLARIVRYTGAVGMCLTIRNI